MKFPDHHFKKIFLINIRNIRHTGGTLKIVLLGNTKMFQLQITLIKFSLLVTKRKKIDHLVCLYMIGHSKVWF